MCNKRERCPVCGRFFSKNERYVKKRKKLGQKVFYCSRSCGGRALSKLGITQQSNRDRAGKKKGSKKESRKKERTAADREWVKDILKRDKYQCQHCGVKEKLQAHHILAYAKAPDKRLDLDNGITLCATCHRKEHPELPSHLFYKHYKDYQDADKTKKASSKRSKKAGSS